MSVILENNLPSCICPIDQIQSKTKETDINNTSYLHYLMMRVIQSADTALRKDI